MQAIHISEPILADLRDAAARRGMDTDAYAEELLALSLAALRAARADSRPYRALEFSGIAPTGRTAAEVEAEIQADRDAWDARP